MQALRIEQARRELRGLLLFAAGALVAIGVLCFFVGFLLGVNAGISFITGR